MPELHGSGHPIDFQNPKPVVITVPDTAAFTMARTDAAQTFTGVQTMTAPVLTSPVITNPTISATAPVAVTTSTVTLGASHVGRVVVLDRATGIAVTLPASSGSGSTYKLFVKTTFTGVSTVKVANATDVLSGNATLYQDGGATVVGFAATVADDTIDLLGTSNSTGGIAGEVILLTDVASGVWAVEIVSDAGGTESTPFSSTV